MRVDPFLQAVPDMKSIFPVFVILALLHCTRELTHAAPANEQDLVRVLTSQASPQEKDAACAQLKRVGTAACVPALAALLPDEQLSHSARYALETLACPEAGQALLEALPRTQSLTKAGIAASLGIRREAGAVKGLAGCLLEGDTAVAVVAARARLVKSRAFFFMLRMFSAKCCASIFGAACSICRRCWVRPQCSRNSSVQPSGLLKESAMNCAHCWSARTSPHFVCY